MKIMEWLWLAGMLVLLGVTAGYLFFSTLCCVERMYP